MSMIKVKEYLDTYFYQYDGDKSTATLKSDGHYEVHGYWEYPKGIAKSENDRFKENFKNLNDWIPKDQMELSINNETLSIRMIIIDGKSVSKYGYLQTYKHISRGLPDDNGYYARSTDEEIIKYLESYYNIIARKRKRKDKLKKLENNEKNRAN